MKRLVTRISLGVGATLGSLYMFAGRALAQTSPPVPTVPTPGGTASVNVSLPDLTGTGTSNTAVVILVLTVLSIAPALLVMLTSFTRIVITFSLARQALGAPQLPPNQVVVGLSLLLSLIVMAPTFSKINESSLQPLLNDKISIGEAVKQAEPAVREFLLKNTRDEELGAMRKLAGEKSTTPVAKTSFSALAPAFVLSEIRTAFTLGFLIFLPFLIIDLVVASVLMSLGLMFLPPTFVSLPLKILLFVMLGGWTLIAETVVRSFA
jgi:flagellar biosynthetic protein FliP